MKLYELIILTIATVIAWPLVSGFFKAIGYRVAALFWKSGYPVKYTSPKGVKKTFYLRTAKDVVEFTNDPVQYVKSHRLHQ